MGKQAQTAEVITREESNEQPRQEVVSREAEFTNMIRAAFDKNLDLARIDRLMQLQREAKADHAREEFYKALSEFKKVPIEIIKDKTNSHYGNTYTSIGNQVNPVNAAMAPFGLSTDWEIDQSDPARIKVACVMTHTLGHTKSVYLSAPPDKSGSKNDLQQIKSTLTYLELATHQAVTGIVAVDAANLDDDGNAARKNGNDPQPVAITESQVKELDKLIKATGTDLDSFLSWAECGSLQALPPKSFKAAHDMLLQRKAKQEKKAQEAAKPAAQ